MKVVGHERLCSILGHIVTAPANPVGCQHKGQQVACPPGEPSLSALKVVVLALRDPSARGTVTFHPCNRDKLQTGLVARELGSK